MQEHPNRSTDPVFKSDSLEQVYEGMKVLDAAGEELGKVQYLRFGDPQAVTPDPLQSDSPGLVGRLKETFLSDELEPDLPEPLRSQYRRYGFLKIDTGGVLGLETDLYARADQIASVEGDTVRLRLRRDQLAEEE